MYNQIECPKPAYDRLVQAGIDKRILAKQKYFGESFLYDNPFTQEGEKILQWAKKALSKPNKTYAEIQIGREVLKLEAELIKKENGWRIRTEELEELLMTYPTLFAKIVLQDDVEKFEQYGFSSRKSLEETIASFCVGEKETLRGWNDTNYIWRQGNSKNVISLNMHGDLYAGQADISGVEKTERTLFGEEVIFDTSKLTEWNGISSHQEWSQFLIATLRYAQAIGKEKIPEIINWRQVLAEVGQVGTNTAEAIFGHGSMDQIPFLMEQQLLSEEDTRALLIRIWASNEHEFLPCIKDKELLYLAQDQSGEIRLNHSLLKDRKYAIRIIYKENDLPHILKATYRFFARDKSLLPKIMDAFLN